MRLALIMRCLTAATHGECQRPAAELVVDMVIAYRLDLFGLGRSPFYFLLRTCIVSVVTHLTSSSKTVFFSWSLKGVAPLKPPA